MELWLNRSCVTLVSLCLDFEEIVIKHKIRDHCALVELTRWKQILEKIAGYSPKGRFLGHTWSAAQD